MSAPGAVGGRRRRRPPRTTRGSPGGSGPTCARITGAVAALGRALPPPGGQWISRSPTWSRSRSTSTSSAATGPGSRGSRLLFVATLLVQYGLRYAQIYLATWTGQRVVHDLRDALFAHVQRLPAAFFDRNPVGRVMTRILGDVEAIGEVFTAGVVAIVGDVITLAGVVAVMLLLHFRLTLVTFAVLPILVGVAWLLRGTDPAGLPGRAGPAGPPERGPPGDPLGHDGDPALRARGGPRRRARRPQRALPAGAVPAHGTRLVALRGRRGHRGDRRRRPPLVGRHRDPRRHAHLRRPRGLHAVHAALLPADPRRVGQVLGHAGGHRRRRAGVRAA